MKEEFDMLTKQGTWKLAKLPDRRRVTSGKWVYKKKRDADGRVKHFKARWVARGFTQLFRTDYHDTYAPTAKPSTIHTVIGIATARGWKIWQIDFVLAFLQGLFYNSEVIYMEQPHRHEDRTDRVCKLLLPIYRLKQSTRNWYITFRKKAAKAGLVPCKSDKCLFTILSRLMLVLHVERHC